VLGEPGIAGLVILDAVANDRAVCRFDQQAAVTESHIFQLRSRNADQEAGRRGVLEPARRGAAGEARELWRGMLRHVWEDVFKTRGKIEGASPQPIVKGGGEPGRIAAAVDQRYVTDVRGAIDHPGRVRDMPDDVIVHAAAGDAERVTYGEAKHLVLHRITSAD
jgi:hypothetical protein